MQDTKNLKKKMKEYKKELFLALENGDHYLVNYWNDQIGILSERIKRRHKNGLKNKKQFKKANGHGRTTATTQKDRQNEM